MGRSATRIESKSRVLPGFYRTVACVLTAFLTIASATGADDGATATKTAMLKPGAKKVVAPSATATPKKPKPAPPNTLTFLLRPTSLLFSQTGIPTFRVSLLTGEVDYRRVFVNSSWTLGLNASGTILPLNSQVPDGSSMRVLSAAWRLGYRLPWISSPWGLEVAGGSFFQTMLVSENGFGFQNLTGPQVVLRSARMFRPAGAAPFLITGSVKYLKFFGVEQSSVLSNSEVGVELAWNGSFFRLPINVTAQYSTFSFDDGTDSIRMKSLSLGAGYRFQF